MSDQASLLFGADPAPGLVAFALAGDGRGIRVWRREGDRTETEVVPFAPFLLLADPALVADAPGLLEIEPLAGPGALRWRARFGADVGGVSDAVFYCAAAKMLVAFCDVEDTGPRV